MSPAATLAALRLRVHRWTRRHHHRRQDRVPHGPPQRRRKPSSAMIFLLSVCMYVCMNQHRHSCFVVLSSQCNVVEPADVKKVATTLQRAIKVVGTPVYEEMVRNCMIQDLSWKVRTPAPPEQSAKPPRLIDRPTTRTRLAPVADRGLICEMRRALPRTGRTCCSASGSPAASQGSKARRSRRSPRRTWPRPEEFGLQGP